MRGIEPAVGAQIGNRPRQTGDQTLDRQRLEDHAGREGQDLLTGDAEQDNLVLETWFCDKQAFSVRDTEFDLIYVNGDNTLENIRLADESWKVRLTEEDFQRLMFEGTE